MSASRPGSDTGKAVVFGGAGFVGRHLCTDLLAQGTQTVVSADIAEPKWPIDGVREVRCDVRDEVTLPAEGLEGAQVYDLAAVHRTPGHPDHAYYDTNVAGAQNIARFASRLNSPHVIFTSSIAVYGPDQERKDEKSVLTPNSAYGRSKILAEGIYRDWAEGAPERRLTIVRPAVIFGPGEDGNFTRFAAALRRGTFAYPGRVDTVKACGYVGELMRCLRFARALETKSFTFNFCYPETARIDAIAEAFHDVAGFAKPRLVLPMGVMTAAAIPFEVMAAAGIKTGINRARVAKLVHSTNIAPTALLEAGYTFETDLREGLRRWSAASEGRFV